MANKLTHNNLLSIEKDIFKPIEKTVKANGQEFVVKIHKKFKNVEVARILTEVVTRSERARELKMQMDITGHLFILLIKYFTDIIFPVAETKEEEMYNDIRTLNALINLGLFEQIIEEFDQEEVDKIVQMFEKNKDNLKQLSETVIAQEYGIEAVEDLIPEQALETIEKEAE